MTVKQSEERAPKVDSMKVFDGALVFHVVLVVFLWLVLYLLGAKITDTVVIATTGAIFGPGALKVGMERFQNRSSDSGR